MKSIFFVTLLCAPFVAMAATPAFCHNLDCPEFKTLQTVNNIVEIRSYPPQKWASFTELNVEFDATRQDGFMKLFNYISGDNDQKTKIDMTAPVLVRAIASQGPFCKTNFTTSFFVPFKYQAAEVQAPVPSATSQVYLDTISFDKVAVLSFGGYAKFADVQTNLLALYKALDDNKIAYDGDNWGYAGYDAPFRIVGRHNEVWVPLV
jgi:hypothetical protein